MASGAGAMAQPHRDLSKSDEKKNTLKSALIMSQRHRGGPKMVNTSATDSANQNQAVKLAAAVQNSARVISPQMQEVNTARSSKRRKGAAGENRGELGPSSAAMVMPAT